MKAEAIEVIIFLLQSKQPKTFDQIHRFLLNNPDYERRVNSYKKEGKKILKRLLKGLLLSAHFDTQIDETGETIYFAYGMHKPIPVANNVQFIRQVPANDEEVYLSDNLIQDLLYKRQADHALLNKLAYLDDDENKMLYTVITAIKNESGLDVQIEDEFIENVQPVYIAVKSLQVFIQFEQEGEHLSVSISVLTNVTLSSAPRESVLHK